MQLTAINYERGITMTEGERKRIEEQIRALKAALQWIEKSNPKAAEGLRNEIKGLESYLRGW